MKTSTVLALGAVTALVAAFVACKSQPPANPQPIYADDAGAMLTPTPEAAAPVMAASEEAGAPEAAGPNPAIAVFDAAAQELLKTQLKPLAAKQAPGMKAEGQLLGGLLNEGQTVEQQAMFYPGKCYTIVGTSPAGVTELDITVSLATPLPTISPVVGIDNMTGPQAFVGAHPNCLKNPLPIGGMVKISMKATKGSGVAGAQLYVK